MAGKLTLQNDYELRGYTLTARRPAAVLDLSYDDPSGIYLNASVIGALSNEYNPGLLGLIGNVGYARRVGPNLSLDGGVTRLEFHQLRTSGRKRGYTEVYLGGAAGALSAHVYYSPHYFYSGASTVYGEVEGSVGAWAKVRLNAHVGVLDYLRVPTGLPIRSTHYDWRVGASRQFGRFDLHAAVSGGGPGYEYYNHALHEETALVVGAGWTF